MNDKSVVGFYIHPKKIFDILFSRTSVGMYYKKHIDLTYTSEGRRDYSFTIFLNDPHTYQGGELILSIPPEQKVIKLEAGSVIIYPTKYLHEVREVTQGERIVCVGWIESMIKEDHERELLAYIIIAMAQVVNSENDKAIQSLNIAFNRLKKQFAS